MSADSDDINGPAERNTISTGAAADSAESDEKLKELPRLLRFAILSDRDNEIVYERLAADIAELAPGLIATTAWVGDSTNAELGMTLAAELDQLRLGEGGLLDQLRRIDPALANARHAAVRQCLGPGPAGKVRRRRRDRCLAILDGRLL